MNAPYPNTSAGPETVTLDDKYALEQAAPS